MFEQRRLIGLLKDMHTSINPIVPKIDIYITSVKHPHTVLSLSLIIVSRFKEGVKSYVESIIQILDLFFSEAP